MHAFVLAEVWNIFQDVVHEGKIYVVHNFKVIEAKGSLRLVSSTMSIILIQSIVVNDLFHDIPAIPMNKFEFVPFGKLFDFDQFSMLNQAPSRSAGLLKLIIYLFFWFSKYYKFT